MADRSQRVGNRRGDGELLRAQLLAAATALLVAPRRVEPPSLRAVARASGVSPSAVYLHFDSQAELVATVVAGQYAELRAALDDADDTDIDPAGRLGLLAEAYVTWGLAHPGAYQLLFESADVLPPTAPGDDVTGPGLDLLDRVAELVDLVGSRPERGSQVALQIWAALHGLVSLRLHKQEAPWLRDAISDGRRIVAALHAPDA